MNPGTEPAGAEANQRGFGGASGIRVLTLCARETVRFSVIGTGLGMRAGRAKLVEDLESINQTRHLGISMAGDGRSTLGNADRPAAAHDASIGRAVESMSLERFQKEVVRGTFMVSQGRQWLQISVLDAIFRMLREAGTTIPWQALESAESRRTVRKRALPPGHVEIINAHELESVFELWLKIA